MYTMIRDLFALIIKYSINSLNVALTCKECFNIINSDFISDSNHKIICHVLTNSVREFWNKSLRQATSDGQFTLVEYILQKCYKKRDLPLDLWPCAFPQYSKIETYLTQEAFTSNYGEQRIPACILLDMHHRTNRRNLGSPYGWEVYKTLGTIERVNNK